MRLRRVAIAVLLPAVGSMAACTTLLGGFEVDDSALQVDAATIDSAPADGRVGPDAADAPDAPAPDTGVDARTDGPSDAAPDALVCSPEKLLCGGACVSHSPAHCGSCSPCPASAPLCTLQEDGGAPICVSNCPLGTISCSGKCADTTSDPEHCGGCTKACVAPANAVPTCRASTCSFECRSGYHLCGGACVSNTDVATCGASCTACPTVPNAVATCDGRSCGLSCADGHHRCGDSCVSNTAVSSCGTSCTPCSTPFNATATCNGTSCGFVCNGGLTQCTNGCYDTVNDPQRCGSCTRACAGTGATCTGGACSGRYGTYTPYPDSINISRDYVWAEPAYTGSPVVVTHLGGYFTVAGVVNFGLYTGDGGGPGKLIVTSGPVYVPGNGHYEVRVTDVRLPAGQYWVGFQSSDETVNFGGEVAGPYRPARYYAYYPNTGALPNAYPLSGATDSPYSFNVHFVGRE